MDNFTNNSNNGNKPALHKSRSNTAFSHATVNKSDVGDFQEGVFVMADMPTLPHRNKTHKTPERNQRKNEHSNNYQHRNQQTRERSTNHLDQRESDTNVSNVRITTSPTRSPPRNKRISNSHSPQRSQHQTTHPEPTTTAVPIVSPHKPRKAHSQTHIHYEKRVERTESSLLFPPDPSSPSKQPKGPSPPRDRWAGPAFSNAPPPSSLPIPDFPPFNPSQSAATSSLSSSPLPTSPIMSTSPPVPGPSMFVPQQPMMMYREPLQYVPPHQPPVIYSHVAYNGFPLHVVYEPSQPSLAELSTDLRRMLNIGGQPILA